MLSQKIIVKHAFASQSEAAEKISRLARHFNARIKLMTGDEEYNAKSLLGMAVADIRKGDEVTVEAAGQDEAQAARAVILLLEEGTADNIGD